MPAEYKVSMAEITDQVNEALNAPLPGLTREDRWEEMEVDGWASLQNLPGQ